MNRDSELIAEAYGKLLFEGLEEKLPVMIKQFPVFTEQQIREIATLDQSGNATKYLTWILKYVATPLWQMQPHQQGGQLDSITGLDHPPRRPITDEEVAELAHRPGTKDNRSIGISVKYPLNGDDSP